MRVEVISETHLGIHKFLSELGVGYWRGCSWCALIWRLMCLLSGNKVPSRVDRDDVVRYL